jgi:hypothetical protein
MIGEDVLCEGCGGNFQLREFIPTDIRGNKQASKYLCLGCFNSACQAEKKETVIAYEETF